MLYSFCFSACKLSHYWLFHWPSTFRVWGQTDPFLHSQHERNTQQLPYTSPATFYPALDMPHISMLLISSPLSEVWHTTVTLEIRIWWWWKSREKTQATLLHSRIHSAGSNKCHNRDIFVCCSVSSCHRQKRKTNFFNVTELSLESHSKKHKLIFAVWHSDRC